MLPSLSVQERDALRDLTAMYRQIGIAGEPAMWDDKFLHQGLSTMSDPKEVIDIGCGTGRVIPLMKKLGIKRYFGVDPLGMCIEHCKTTHPKHHFEVGEARQVGKKYPGRFNGFLFLSVLNHIPRAGQHLDQVLQSTRACLVPHAPGIIIMHLGIKGRFTANMGGVKITLFTHEEVKDGLARNGFHITDEVIRDPHNNGVRELRALVTRTS